MSEKKKRLRIRRGEEKIFRRKEGTRTSDGENAEKQMKMEIIRHAPSITL